MQWLYDVIPLSETDMNKQSENRIVHTHVAYLQVLQLPLFESLIPDYLQTLALEEQEVLLRRARKWLWRYWDKRTQTLKYPRYLASVGQLNEETLCAYLFIVNYAYGDDCIAQ